MVFIYDVVGDDVVVGGPIGHLSVQVSHFVNFPFESIAVAHHQYLFCHDTHQLASLLVSERNEPVNIEHFLDKKLVYPPSMKGKIHLFPFVVLQSDNSGELSIVEEANDDT